MKKIVLFAATCLFAAPVVAQSTQYVHGYTRSDGTYVAPYYRTTPNNTNVDNWSTRPNVNPYTGRPGTVQPNYNSNYQAPNYGGSTYSNPTCNNYPGTNNPC